jgi:hypothetical protein
MDLALQFASPGAAKRRSLFGKILNIYHFCDFRYFWSRELSVPAPVAGLRIAATLLRTVFICLLIAVTLRVAMPQNETIWTADDTPADLVRLILGVVVCVFLGAQLFYGPKDAHAYRTWLYLGLAVIPITLVLLVVVW